MAVENEVGVCSFAYVDDSPGAWAGGAGWGNIFIKVQATGGEATEEELWQMAELLRTSDYIQRSIPVSPSYIKAAGVSRNEQVIISEPTP